MVTALEIGAGFVLTVNPADRHHGSLRLPARTSRDPGRRAAPGLGADAPRIRDGRSAGTMKGTTMMAALALFAALGGSSLVDARAPEECRRECALDLEACRNACIDSRDFDGCLEECHSVEEDCLVGCR